jgi:hypothetical protein
VAALERLVGAAGEATHIAFDLVPIGEDAVGTANGDGVVFLRLPLPLLPIGSFALGLFGCRSGRHGVLALRFCDIKKSWSSGSAFPNLW